MNKASLETLVEWLIAHQAVDYDMIPGDLTTIKRLDLSGKSIDILPENFGELSGLIALNLSNNHLESLPESFSRLTQLVNLNLRRNNFSAVPEELMALPLKSINFNANKLKSITPISSCTTLHVIDLSANALTDVSNIFESLEHLRSLNLSLNFISKFDIIKSHESLEILNISSNLIQELSESLILLSDLRVLEAANNEITSIASALSHLEIETLDLSSNQLEQVHLEGFEDLESLVLDDNPMQTLTFDSDFAPSLRSFSCEGCEMEVIDLPPSEVLEQISLASNELKILPEAIPTLKHLAELGIDNNNIVSLPEGLVHMPLLDILYIDHNPLDAASIARVQSMELQTCDLSIKPEIAIRKAQFDDLRVMAHLISQLFTIESDFSVDYKKQYNGLKLLFNETHATILMAKHKNNAIGMITMQRQISTSEGSYVGVIEDLVVDESFRKMGIGTLLIESIMEIAHNNGFSRIQLAADKENIKALNFYQQRGFSKTNLNIYRFNDPDIQ